MLLPGEPRCRADLLGVHLIRTKITFDPSKLTLKQRALDFAWAGEVFAGLTATIIDDRFDYGETRFITAGHLDGRLVVMVWRQRGEARHVISMRHCHAKQEKIWRRRMDRSR
jgi:uncharacterized protein